MCTPTSTCALPWLRMHMWSGMYTLCLTSYGGLECPCLQTSRHCSSSLPTNRPCSIVLHENTGHCVERGETCLPILLATISWALGFNRTTNSASSMICGQHGLLSVHRTCSVSLPSSIALFSTDYAAIFSTFIPCLCDIVSCEVFSTCNIMS